MILVVIVDELHEMIAAIRSIGHPFLPVECEMRPKNLPKFFREDFWDEMSSKPRESKEEENTQTD